MKSRLFVLALGCLLVGCSHGRKIKFSPSENRVTRSGAISLSAEWLKDKGKRFDIGLRLRNEHEKPVIVLLREMRCYRGNTEGVLKHTFFNTGERTIDLRVGQLKSFKFDCVVGERTHGDFRVIVGRVYENGSGDGRSLGKVLAQDVEWRAVVSAE